MLRNAWPVDCFHDFFFCVCHKITVALSVSSRMIIKARLHRCAVCYTLNDATADPFVRALSFERGSSIDVPGTLNELVDHMVDVLNSSYGPRVTLSRSFMQFRGGLLYDNLLLSPPIHWNDVTYQIQMWLAQRTLERAIFLKSFVSLSFAFKPYKEVNVLHRDACITALIFHLF